MPGSFRLDNVRFARNNVHKLSLPTIGPCSVLVHGTFVFYIVAVLPNFGTASSINVMDPTKSLLSCFRKIKLKYLALLLCSI